MFLYEACSQPQILNIKLNTIVKYYYSKTYDLKRFYNFFFNQSPLYKAQTRILYDYK